MARETQVEYFIFYDNFLVESWFIFFPFGGITTFVINDDGGLQLTCTFQYLLDMDQEFG